MQDLDDFAKPDLDKLERLADNYKWIHKQHDNLKEKYDKKFVAIKDRKISDKDTSLDSLIKRLNIRNYDESIAVELSINDGSSFGALVLIDTVAKTFEIK